MNLKRIWDRLRHRDRAEADLDAEVRSFYDAIEERHVREGMTPEDARRAARLAFDDPGRVKERVREARVEAVLETTLHDLRYAARMLRKNPGFAAVAILSLGLGLGANTAIFTLVNDVLLKSLPVRQPERLFFVDNSGGKSGGGSGPPYPCYEILRDRNQFFSGMSAFSSEMLRVTVDGAQEMVRGQYASGTYFDILGVNAVRGRVLTPADDAEAARVAVISYGLWERRFGRAPDILGRKLLVGTTPVSIVGVTPPGFHGLSVGFPIDVTVPMTLTANNLRAKQYWWFSVVGRLKDGAPPETARAELDGYFKQYMREIGSQNSKYFSGIALVPAAKGLAEIRRQFSRPLLIVMTIVGLVLLIGCANVANLLLARASARRHEIGLRLAIGASRGRLVRQLLTEGLLLVALAAIAGLFLARTGVALLVGLFAGVNGRIVLQPQIDARVLGFTAAVALITALLFSLAPALHAVRSRADRPGARAGNALVVVQIMLSVVLLCGAALFLRTLRNLASFDAGFDREGVLLARVDATLPQTPPLVGPAEEEEHAKRARMWEDLVQPVRALPEIRAAALSTITPLSRRDRGVVIDVAGVPRPPGDRGIHLNHVTAGYFETFAIAPLAGRLFTGADTSNSPKVAILNESAARREVPDGNPIGRRITFPGQQVVGPYEIVGVVRDTRYESLRKAAEPMVYVPIPQAVDRLGGVFVAVRARGDHAAIQSFLRKRVQAVVTGGFMGSVSTLRQQVDDSLLQERLLSILASLFGGLALLLAAIGLYGIMSFRVIRRTREIGIRIAIGARRGEVLWLILRSTFGLATLGLALGIAAVLYAKRYIESELFGLGGADPLAIGSAALVLLTVAAAAGAWPAWRAARLDPMTCLREE